MSLQTQVSSFSLCQHKQRLRKSNSLTARCYYWSKKLNHDVIRTNTLCRFLLSYLLRVTIDKQARSVPFSPSLVPIFSCVHYNNPRRFLTTHFRFYFDYYLSSIDEEKWNQTTYALFVSNWFWEEKNANKNRRRPSPSRTTEGQDWQLLL